MVVVFLRIFQRDEIITPGAPWNVITTVMTLVGWYATIAIMIGTTYALIGRIKKSKQPYKNSHGTDWMFLILLQLTTITGIMVHIFIYLGWPLHVYTTYVIHLMVAIPMLTLEGALCQVGPPGLSSGGPLPVKGERGIRGRDKGQGRSGAKETRPGSGHQEAA